MPVGGISCIPWHSIPKIASCLRLSVAAICLVAILSYHLCAERSATRRTIWQVTDELRTPIDVAAVAAQTRAARVAEANSLAAIAGVVKAVVPAAGIRERCRAAESVVRAEAEGNK